MEGSREVSARPRIEIHPPRKRRKGARLSPHSAGVSRRRVTPSRARAHREEQQTHHALAPRAASRLVASRTSPVDYSLAISDSPTILRSEGVPPQTPLTATASRCPRLETASRTPLQATASRTPLSRRVTDPSRAPPASPLDSSSARAVPSIPRPRRFLPRDSSRATLSSRPRPRPRLRPITRALVPQSRRGSTRPTASPRAPRRTKPRAESLSALEPRSPAVVPERLVAQPPLSIGRVRRARRRRCASPPRLPPRTRRTRPARATPLYPTRARVHLRTPIERQSCRVFVVVHLRVGAGVVVRADSRSHDATLERRLRSSAVDRSRDGGERARLPASRSSTSSERGPPPPRPLSRVFEGVDRERRSAERVLEPDRVRRPRASPSQVSSSSCSWSGGSGGAPAVHADGERGDGVVVDDEQGRVEVGVGGRASERRSASRWTSRTGDPIARVALGQASRRGAEAGVVDARRVLAGRGKHRGARSRSAREASSSKPMSPRRTLRREGPSTGREPDAVCVGQLARPRLQSDAGRIKPVSAAPAVGVEDVRRADARSLSRRPRRGRTDRRDRPGSPWRAASLVHRMVLNNNGDFVQEADAQEARGRGAACSASPCGSPSPRPSR